MKGVRRQEQLGSFARREGNFRGAGSTTPTRRPMMLPSVPYLASSSASAPASRWCSSWGRGDARCRRLRSPLRFPAVCPRVAGAPEPPRMPPGPVPESSRLRRLALPATAPPASPHDAACPSRIASLGGVPRRSETPPRAEAAAVSPCRRPPRTAWMVWRLRLR
jgi:hypothetical protein